MGGFGGVSSAWRIDVLRVSRGLLAFDPFFSLFEKTKGEADDQVIRQLVGADWTEPP